MNRAQLEHVIRRVAVDHGLFNFETLLRLVDATPVEPERRDLARGRIKGLLTPS